MAVNPTYDRVKIGDEYFSSISHFQGCSWIEISRVIDMKPISTRFGKPDRIVTVEIRTNEGGIIDERKPIWVSQLLQGLT